MVSVCVSAQTTSANNSPEWVKFGVMSMGLRATYKITPRELERTWLDTNGPAVDSSVVKQSAEQWQQSRFIIDAVPGLLFTAGNTANWGCLYCHDQPAVLIELGFNNRPSLYYQIDSDTSALPASIRKYVYDVLIQTSRLIAETNANKETKNQGIKEKYLSSYKLIKKYDYNPHFYLDMNSYNCTYEVLINDMPAYSFYGSGNQGGTVFPVSPLILKSGKQAITIRVFPQVDDNDKMARFLLAKNCGLEVKVVAGDDDKETPKEYKQLFRYKMPEVQQDNVPYLEYTGVLEATTPYHLKGWSESQDLRKEDKARLTTEVLAFYLRYRQLMADRKMDEIAGLVYNREVEVEQALFQNKPGDAADTWDRFAKIKTSNLDMLPLEHYELKFFGNGRVVGLIRTDDALRGESAMTGIADNKYKIYSLLLHKPAGSHQLQVIR
ncbi:hypothetical protein [Chitinophaga fulva]|nr:hypothetical protein [Chitinophaga fulva]